jgi:hypothetical protein
MSKGNNVTDNYGRKFNTQEELEEAEALQATIADRIRRVAGNYVSFQKQRIARTESQRFIIENILPEGELHILAGPSGVGKSTLILPMLKAIEDGTPIMGFKTIPVPFVYIMCDSTSTSLQRKLNRIGLGDWDIPAYSIEDLAKPPFSLKPHTVEIEDLPIMFPWAKLFILEAYNWFYKAKSPNASKDYVDILQFWSRVRDFFGEKNLTIVGTTHIAKQKKNEGYALVRDKVFGSVAQPAICSTVMVLEQGRGDDDRTLHVSPRDYPEFKAEFLRDKEGKLHFSKVVGNIQEKMEAAQEDLSSFQLLDRKLLAYMDQEILAGSVVKGWCQELGLSTRTAFRWIANKLEIGDLIKVQQGQWRVRRNIISIG